MVSLSWRGGFNILDVYRSLVPDVVFRRIIEGKRISSYKILDLTVLYTDISGFTRMSESLSRFGREGSEELAKIINSYFTKLISMAVGFKGDIYGFGGDAIFAFFEGADKEERAIKCASCMMNLVKKNRRVKRFKRTFKIGMHIGIASGRAVLKDLGTKLFMGGEAFGMASKIISKTKNGEIAVDQKTFKALSDQNFFRKGNFYFLKRTKNFTIPHNTRPESRRSKRIMKELTFYIPDFIIERLTLKPFFEASDGEHKRVTSVFIYIGGVDFEGHPSQAARILDKFYRILLDTCQIYGGYINKFDIGDKGKRVFITFGFPKTQEDDHIRAINFCYDLLHHQDLKKLDLKIGINSGNVFACPVGSILRSEFTIMGDAVNLAARLASRARNGEILITSELNKKVGAMFATRKKGRFALKGKRKEVEIFKIVDRINLKADVIRRWVSKSSVIVGRKKEIKKIKEIIKAVKDNEGQVIYITGAPGIGKSRLAKEMIRMCLKDRFQIYEGECLSYGSSFSYYPWAQIFERYFGLLPSENINQKKRKIEKKCIQINPALKDWLPVIGVPLGIFFPETEYTRFLDAKLKRQRIFDLVLDLLQYESEKGPIAIIFDDLQWADNVSFELLNYVARNIRASSILVVILSRPVERKLEFLGENWCTEFKLRELSEQETLLLIRNILNIQDLPETLKNVIFEKSQGNPFYVEEIVKSLIEVGNIYFKGKKWHFRGDIRKIEIPDRVERILMTRIDRLNYRTKDVLHYAAVLGKEFSEYYIRNIYPDRRYAKETLKVLNALGLITIYKEGGINVPLNIF